MSRQQRIFQILSSELSPLELIVENESPNHRAREDAESHFKVVVVTEQFEHCSRVARHRMVNQLLQGEFDLGLHALSLQLYTSSEWAARENQARHSPDCQHKKV